MAEIRARPLEWDEQPEYQMSMGEKEWTDKRMGFHIGFYPEEPVGERYCAAWGEGDPERFGTLDEAKQWCQSEVDAWVRENAVIVE